LFFHTKPRDWLAKRLQNDLFCVEWDVKAQLSRSWQNSNGVMPTPNAGIKCRWGRINAGAVAENWRLLTRSIVSLARLQVYYTERVHVICLQHVHRSVSTSRGFVSDS